MPHFKSFVDEIKTRLLWKVYDALEVDLAAAPDVDLLVAGAGDPRTRLWNELVHEYVMYQLPTDKISSLN